MRRASFLLFLFVVCLADAQLAGQVNQSSTLTGTIVDRESGRAVADAQVVVQPGGATTSTNGAGRFRIEGVAAGRLTLTVSARGYLDRQLTDVQVGSGGAPLAIELEPTPNFMDRVQVTGTMTPLAVGDLAAPADQIPRSLIEARGDQTLTQAIAHVPGAVVSTQLGLFESVLFRGMPRDSVEFTSTLLMVDGVPQTNANNAARVTALPINDTASIEVVRGPNSALYGRTAIGGAVHVHTADPTPDHQISLELTAGELKTLNGIGRISGPIKDWGGYFISAGGQRDSGYFENLVDDDFAVGNSAVFGKFAFSPDERASGFVSFTRVVSHNSTPTNEPVVDGRLLHEVDPRFNRFSNFNIPGPNYNQRESRLTLNYSRQLSPWARLTEVFGYRAIQHEFVDDGDFIGAPYDLEAGTITMYPFSQDLNEDNFYQELRAELAPSFRNLRHNLVVGGSYERNKGSLESDFIYTDVDLFGWTISYLNPVIPPRSSWQHDLSSRTYKLGITGLFAQYMIEPARRLVLTAGGRYDRLAMENTRASGTAEVTVDAFSPKLNATVRVLEDPNASGTELNVYAAYSAAFLPPRRASSLLPADVPLNLRPEDIDNYEGGVKGSLLGGRASFEATYFWMKEDGVVLTTRQGPFFLPTNAGVQQYKGVETGVRYRFDPRVSGYVNASFYRNRFGDFVIQSEDGDEALTGNRLPISPDTVVNWGFSLLPRPNIEAVFDVKHVGAVVGDRANTVTYDRYSVVDAAVTWRRGPLRFTLSAHNLLDAEYYWNGDDEVADPARPRQVLLTTGFTLR